MNHAFLSMFDDSGVMLVSKRHPIEGIVQYENYLEIEMTVRLH